MEFPSNDFDTLIAAPKREPKAAPQNFVPVTERMFTECCPRCGGSGRFGNLGQCSKARGIGPICAQKFGW